MRISFGPGHHLCLGIVSCCMCVHQLALVAGPGDLHTSPGLYVAYMYPRQCAQAPGMYMMEHNDPRGCAMLSLHRWALGHSGRALFVATMLLMHCRSFLFCSRRFSADHKAPLHTDAQLSFSRSRAHVCLQALLVPMFDFEHVSGPLDCLRSLLPPFIRPFLLAFYRYSSPHTPLVAPLHNCS